MADKKVKGAGDRFLPGSNIAKHREWRGLKDTWYDYVEWVKVLGIMGGFVAKSPVRIARGMLTYRWMGSYLGALNMIDRCVEGLRGPALRVARLYLNTIMKGSTTSIAEMMMGDRRFGDNAFGRTQVVLEQTMCPEILAGFQNLRPAQLEPFQGLLLCYMDQGANPYYIDAMESVGLPADSCRLSNNAAGVALLDEFPKIGACCISNNAPCDSSTMNSQLIERHLDVDTLPAAIPMRWEDPHTRKYARESLRRIIDFVERHTGETYDWDACRAVMEKHNDEVRNEQEKWGFMATPYTAAALAVPALFHTFYYAFSGGRNPEVMKTEHKVMRILEQAYADKTNCFPKTRYRALTWGGPPCYWLQFPNWLYNCWGILMIAGMDLFSGNVIIDTTDEETILDGIARNYETGVMRRHLTGGWRHLVEFWDEAEKFHCDMVILHDDITCKGALGLTRRRRRPSSWWSRTICSTTAPSPAPTSASRSTISCSRSCRQSRSMRPCCSMTITRAGKQEEMMMKKLLPKLLLGATGVWVGSMLIYWFNLDNKAIYFLVRPLLDKIYDHRKVDEKV